MFWCTVRITHYAIAIQCGGTPGQYAGLYKDMQDALDTFCSCTVLIALLCIRYEDLTVLLDSTTKTTAVMNLRAYPSP